MILSKTKIETALARNCESVTKFAKRSGVSRSAFDSAMHGKNVRPSTAGRIAAALAVDVLELVREEGRQ